MRTDAATILIGLGFTPLVDFVATQSEPDTVEIVWLSSQPQPSAADLDAAYAADPAAGNSGWVDAQQIAASIAAGLPSLVALQQLVAALVGRVNALETNVGLTPTDFTDPAVLQAAPAALAAKATAGGIKAEPPTPDPITPTQGPILGVAG